MASAVSKYLKSLEARLAALEGKLGVAPPSGASAGAGDAEEEEDAPEWLAAYDELLSGPLATFVATSKSLDAPIAELGEGLKAVFDAVRGVLALAPKCKKPAPAELFASPAGKALQSAMKSVSSVNPGAFGNHAKAVNEALPACNWIAVDTMPHSLVEGQRDAADFWLNKVRVAFKDKEGDHRGWAAQLKDLLTALYTYVKTHHKTGVTWNGRGTPIAETAAAPAPAAATPPPAAAAAPSEDGATKNAAAMAGLAAQLAALDQSSGRTAGLRRVTADMKAKNQKDKPVLKPKKASGGGAAAKKAGGAAKKAAAPKPPRLQLVGKRWFCENQTGMVEVNVEHASQEVYVYNCDSATVLINGKCTALQVDKCVKTQVLFDKVIAAVSVVDCKRLKIQARVECKSFTLDKTDGATVYLNWDSRDAQITTSKCSELNVSFPVSDAEDADWAEQAIPEQFVTTIAADGSVSTHVSELYTHG